MKRSEVEVLDIKATELNISLICGDDALRGNTRFHSEHVG